MIKYTIYIPSKGRPTKCHTGEMLRETGLKFYIVIEPQDYDEYVKNFNKENLLVLPFSNLGLGGYPARNWIKDYSTKLGEKKHWQLDDDLYHLAIFNKGKEIKKTPNEILGLIEQFTDKYNNVGLSGPSSNAFAGFQKKPFRLNQQICNCVLVNNDIPYRWRIKGGHDTDMSIQVLKSGLCTILLNSFVFKMAPTGINEGGNQTELYDENVSKRLGELFTLHPELPIKTSNKFDRIRYDTKRVWRLFKQTLQPINE